MPFTNTKDANGLSCALYVLVSSWWLWSSRLRFIHSSTGFFELTHPFPDGRSTWCLIYVTQIIMIGELSPCNNLAYKTHCPLQKNGPCAFPTNRNFFWDTQYVCLKCTGLFKCRTESKICTYCFYFFIQKNLKPYSCEAQFKYLFLIFFELYSLMNKFSNTFRITNKVLWTERKQQTIKSRKTLPCLCLERIPTSPTLILFCLVPTIVTPDGETHWACNTPLQVSQVTQGTAGLVFHHRIEIEIIATYFPTPGISTPPFGENMSSGSDFGVIY